MADDDTTEQAERIPRSYPQGVPSWVEGQHPDVDAAAAFYGELFGWDLEERMPPQVPGSYRIASVGALDVGALASLPDGVDAARWVTYFAVDDADAGADLVRGAGGTAQDPQDAGPGGSAGRSVMCADPEATAFLLWQARDRLGAQFFNRPGGWVFSDLRSPDPSSSLEFYRRVFGWRVDDMGEDAAMMLAVPGYGDHLEATSDPGIRTRQAGAPPGFEDVFGGAGVQEGAPTWQVRFSVADRDEAAAAIERLGGTVLSTVNAKWTWSADALDPQGAAFTVDQFVPPS